ncbi:MAG: Uma2 family endonuclease [Planctomycetaceae bacterium]|nr:Uma2 family endonuclease [Planctomycetaceae bacterium]
MATEKSWTSDEFLESRFDLPEAGQWSELVEGEVINLQPPDSDHGTVVLNLSKAFSEFAHRTQLGYACFDLGLRLRRSPDTILFPAACYFIEGPRFAESDKPMTDVVPAIVVELASTRERVSQVRAREQNYQEWGVPSIWTINPTQRTVEVASLKNERRLFSGSQWLEGGATLPDFRLPVSFLFAEPEWWSGPVKNGR